MSVTAPKDGPTTASLTRPSGEPLGPLKAPPRVSVVIPTRNEALNLPSLAEILDPRHEIIVVDGHSSDDTLGVAGNLWPKARLLTQTRRGKGNALACGFAAATGDIIVMLDADGSADPREIPRFVRALEEGADFAKGTRFAAGGGTNDITRLRRLGNRLLNGIVNTLFGTSYTDLCYGYNAFRRRCLPALNLSPGERSSQMFWGDGFEIETLINIRVSLAQLRVVEVPSYEAPRLNGLSHLNACRDGLRVLRTILVERRHARRRPESSVIDLDSLEVLGDDEAGPTALHRSPYDSIVRPRASAV